MPVLAKLQSRVRQCLAAVASSRGSSISLCCSIPRGWASDSSSELPEQHSLKEGANFSDRAFGGCPSILAMGDEALATVCTCRADCLSCLALIHFQHNGQKVFCHWCLT